MALRSSSLSQVNISEKTERERLVIAKEVVIKSLLPVVFETIKDEKREEVFDEWFGKLLSLITGAEKEEKKQSKEAALSQKKVVRIQPKVSENKATGKQIKKIWAVAHQLDYGKEDIEQIAGETCNVSHLSELDKWQASKVIDSLIAKLGVQEIYG